MPQSIEAHCDEIERCNQRGGRMLSIVDLIDAGTVSVDVAAYLLATISMHSASFMVGALPGGAGKTTVMGALLNMVPRETVLVAADGAVTIEEALRHDGDGQRCYICHEISEGNYYAYLWDEELHHYFALPAAGHMIATNLHADTYEEAYAQVCTGNSVPSKAFMRMNVIVFINIDYLGLTPQRTVAAIWESDGEREHHLVYAEDRGESPSALSEIIVPDEHQDALKMITTLMSEGARTIQDVRTAFLDDPEF